MTQFEQITKYFDKLSKIDKISFKEYVENFDTSVFTFCDILEEIPLQHCVKFDYYFQVEDFLDLLKQYGFRDNVDLDDINDMFSNYDDICLTLNRGTYIENIFTYDCSKIFYKLGFIVIPYTDFYQKLIKQI